MGNKTIFDGYVIYCATNIENGKKYVGYTGNFAVRKKKHLRDNRFAFHAAIKKWGEDKFEWEILLDKLTFEEANKQEEFYIKKLGSLAPGGYNLTTGGYDAQKAKSVVKQANATRKKNHPETLKEHFESFLPKDKQENECWIWQGNTLPTKNKEYFIVNLSYKHKIYKANRLSYEFYIGEITKGLWVCRTCSNSRCVNPAHLYLATPKQSQENMVSKGRSAVQIGNIQNRLRGEANHYSVLTEAMVAEILRLRAFEHKTTIELSKTFNVCKETINNIFLGTTWKHIERPSVPLKHQFRLKPEVVLEAVKLHKGGMSYNDIATQLSSNSTSISRIISGKIFSNITGIIKQSK